MQTDLSQLAPILQRKGENIVIQYKTHFHMHGLTDSEEFLHILDSLYRIFLKMNFMQNPHS